MRRKTCYREALEKYQTARSYDHPDVASDLANINLRIDTYFINANNIKEPVPNVIYQSPVQNLNVTAVTCGIDYKGKELAFIVPIEENRIVPLNRYQKDQKTKEKRILLAYKIGLINNNTTNITAIGESPEGIMNDLQALISHGGLTLVSNLKHTKNLDNSYGFVRKRGIFRNNRTQIILFAVYLIVVFLLISVVYCLNRQAKIDVILKFILALVTFVFYTIHTYEDAKDVERLALA
ncbi:hypothetical protein RhiirA4_422022, partial [Rhizophagus irregularis]